MDLNGPMCFDNYPLIDGYDIMSFWYKGRADYSFGVFVLTPMDFSFIGDT